MKKVLITVFTICAFAAAVNAQQGKIRVGAGLAAGTEAAIDDDGSEQIGFGINIGGEYFITDAISVAPSYTFFFESEVDVLGFESSIRLNSLNIDGRYYFLQDNIEVYGLAGLSFASVNTTTTIDLFGQPTTVEADGNETGLNIGGGVVLPLGDSFGLNGQIKYNTPLEQLILQAGVLISLN